MKIDQLKYLRHELRISQYELAEASGIPRWKIQLAEQGLRGLEPDEKQAIICILKPHRVDCNQSTIISMV